MPRKKMTKTKRIVKRAFHEVHEMTPKAVLHTMTAVGPERAEKQRVAIALSKARAKGARIPKRKT
jgi:hypothetical protein